VKVKREQRLFGDSEDDEDGAMDTGDGDGDGNGGDGGGGGGGGGGADGSGGGGASDQLPGYKEARCSRVGCNLFAICHKDCEVFCGVHCNKKAVGRVELSKGNYKEYKRQVVELRKKNIERAKGANSNSGEVKVWGNKKSDGTKLKQSEAVGWGANHPSKLGDFYREGYLCVMPNAQHGNVKYATYGAIGYPSLSPKELGPVVHGMEGIPDAKTIEDYHQLSKCFTKDVGADGNPTSEWSEQRKQGYTAGGGKRHSPSRGEGEGNAPRFSVYYNIDTGKEKRFSYIECRLFYCVWMERLAPKTSAFKELKSLIDAGTNVLICGFDGYAEGVTETLYEHYIDSARPFGHELVLYTLLTVGDAADYPWNVYWRENEELYDGMTPAVADSMGTSDGGGAGAGAAQVVLVVFV
jgi:hypothetical protein